VKTAAANDFLHDRRDALGTAPGLAEAGGPEEEAARGRICPTSPPMYMLQQRLLVDSSVQQI
jgi:hypothetical protein